MLPGVPLSMVWDPELEVNPCAHAWGLRALQELEAEVGPQESTQAASVPEPPDGILALVSQSCPHAFSAIGPTA